MQSKMKAIIMALAMLCTIHNLMAQSVFEKIDALMNKAHQNKNFDGAILVAHNDSVIYKKRIWEVQY